MSEIVYVTGVPGAGKSTVRRELRRRGMCALGVDEDHIGAFHTPSGQIVERGDIIDDPNWRHRHEWRIVPQRLERLLASRSPSTVYLCGSAANEADVWSTFTHVVALSIDDQTLHRRLAGRTGNNFGKTESERTLAIDWNKTYSSHMRRIGVHVIDATRPVNEIVTELIERTSPRTR